MTLSFYLFPRLPNRLAEAVVDLFMNTILIFIPNQVWHIVDRRLQKMTGLPKILPHFIRLLPPQKTESYLLVGQRKRPYVLNLRHNI